MSIDEINVIKLKEMFDNKDDFILLDVREDIEVLTSQISKESIHIPMNQIPDRLNELDNKKEIIVHCKSGKRSAAVCKFLNSHDFSNIKNLKGVIKALSLVIDPSIIVF